ncbi:MAG TPA: hypothetical protein VF291_14335, partial [Burkholderiaceae bacterium]
VYKYVYPDGRIVYSDEPVPGARLEAQVEAPPPPDMSSPPAAPPRPVPAAPAPASGKAPATLDQAWDRLKLARQQLKEAKARLESGREPLEGERTGTATGGSRLNDTYWARQKANESAVDAAEKRVREAQEAVNQLR